MFDLPEFLDPVQIAGITDDEIYNDGQFGSHISIFTDEFPDLSGADIILAGISEQRGAGSTMQSKAADAVRRQLYKLYCWHRDITVADVGNIKTGASLADTYAAVKTVAAELLRMDKVIILLGGSHDLTLAQYYAFKELNRITEATVVDATIDLGGESSLPCTNFLLQMLTSEPNFINHYNHIGFQSYLVHPGMLETIDKLRFDCFRVGMVKENIEEMEPVIRNTNMVSFDISAIKSNEAPASKCSPNGLSGEDACAITRYAGMSPVLNSLGIYGYRPEWDMEDLTAKQIAQMIWYFIDGRKKCKQEALFDDKHNFNEYHTSFTEVDTVFLQSKKTGRWWMQLPGKKLIACSYNDYLHASSNRIPERWLRAQERL